MESRLIIRKVACIIISVLLLTVCYILIKHDFESADKSDRETVIKYCECLRENFNQRSDCAREVSSYSYKYLDKLVVQYKIQK